MELEIKRISNRKEKQRERKRKQRDRENNQIHQKEIDVDDLQQNVHQNTLQSHQSLNREEELKFNFVSEEEFIQVTKEFDKLNETLVYRRCTACRQVKLDLQVEMVCFQNNHHLLCSSCRNYSLVDIKQLHQSLPVWWDDNDQIQFQLPEELIGLREGKKLMIQKYSAYIPIHRLYKGQVGAKGHCCAFKQNIMDVTLVLPRKPENIKFVQVIKKYKDKSGNIGEKNLSFDERK